MDNRAIIIFNRVPFRVSLKWSIRGVMGASIGALLIRVLGPPLYYNYDNGPLNSICYYLGPYMIMVSVHLFFQSCHGLYRGLVL